MFRLVAMVLALPWPVMALISVGLFWMAQDAHRSSTQHEAEKAQALLDPVPAPVALDRFTDADVHLADEVHVAAWINTEYNYELTKQRKGTDTVRRMFVLFGPGDAVDSKVARGIVLLRPDEVDGFVAHLVSQISDPMDARLPFHLNGLVDRTPELSDMVADAFEEQSLTKAEAFIAVTPFVTGRAAGLAPDPEAPMRVAMVFGGLGGLAAVIALGKLLAGRGRRKGHVVPTLSDAERVQLVEAAARPVVMPVPAWPTGQGYRTLPTPGTSTWSPLEAVKAKQAATLAKAEPAGGGSAARRKSGPLVRKVAMVLVFLPLYGFVSLFWDAMKPSVSETPETVSERFAETLEGRDAGQNAPDAPVHRFAPETRVVPVEPSRTAAVAARPAAVADGPVMPEPQSAGMFMEPVSFGSPLLSLLVTLFGALLLKTALWYRAERRKMRVADDPWDRLSRRLQ